MAKGKKKTRHQDEFSDEEPQKNSAVNSDTEVVEPVAKPSKKKDKKKKAEKSKFENDASDDDLDPLKNQAEDDLSEEDAPKASIAKKKNKKDKKKKAVVEDSESDEDVMTSKPKSAFAALADDDDDDDEQDELPVKPKGGFAALADSGDEDTNVVKPDDYPESVTEKVKQDKKPKEKKTGKKGKKDEKPAEEEDLDKLLAEMNIEIKDDKKDKKKKKKDKKAQDATGEGEAPAGTMNEADGVEGSGEKVEDPAEGAEAGGEDKKKKKKKKKKDDKEPTPEGDGEDGDGAEKDDKKKKGAKGKKPGKAALAQMQEALRLMKEENERLEAEAEEKAKREEEAENLRIQKLQEEKEKKELKKQREKEKKERLKAEGKLLTKAQKQAQARAQATLEALRAQGIQVPAVTSDKPTDGKVRRANFIPRKRDKTKQEEQKTDDVGTKEDDNSTEKDDTPSTSEAVEVAAEKKAEESGEDVREAWDASSESESEASPAPQPVVAAPAAAKVEKSEDEDEDEEESDDDDDDEDETESESEEESEEEESSEDDGVDKREKIRHRVMERIRKRKELNEKNKSVDNLRSPVICVLGHVDTGKTKILDYIRKTHVQDNEAGGITQQIGATMVPLDAIKEQCKSVKDFAKKPLRIPGALIIDTPGHESFSNLRSRGSSLCDMAILVVDIMHGLEPQTIESINLLKMKRTPFVVALNKIDRLYDWRSNKHKDVVDVIESQGQNTKQEFEKNSTLVITQFAEQGLNAALFHKNTDPKSFISLVPTSAFTGDGMGNLISLVIELTQKMLAQRIAYSEELQATVLEVKALPGLGTTIDVIVVNGQMKEGDLMVLAGHEGPFTTPVRSLLMPQPLRELRVKNAYQDYKVIKGAQGVKIAAKDLDKAIAGLNVLIAHQPDEVDYLKGEMARALKEVMSDFKLQDKGVYVQASTLGSLEALLVFLRDSKIPYSGIRIGPVVKKDVIKASVMLEHDSQYAVILAFDVKVERDAQELADHVGVKIFSADIIYHLFDKFTAHREELRQKKREEFKNIAVFPCKLRILPQFIFKTRDPIICGVMVEAGIVKLGTPICVPSKENLVLGSVSSIELNHKPLESARKGEEICIRIENTTGDAPKLYGRHFEATDMLVSKISRESIDACKEYFRTDLSKQDWQLMVELKKLYQIL